MDDQKTQCALKCDFRPRKGIAPTGQNQLLVPGPVAGNAVRVLQGVPVSALAAGPWRGPGAAVVTARPEDVDFEVRAAAIAANDFASRTHRQERYEIYSKERPYLVSGVANTSPTRGTVKQAGASFPLDWFRATNEDPEHSQLAVLSCAERPIKSPSSSRWRSTPKHGITNQFSVL